MAKDEVQMPEMPSMSLAKSAPKQGTKEWYKAFAKEHGDTDDPRKIEFRRNRLSMQIAVIDNVIKNVQNAKKTLPIQRAEHIASFMKLRAKQAEALDAAARVIFDLETQQQVALLQDDLSQRLVAYEITIAQLTASLAQIEGECLIVDSLTMRFHGRSPITGKKGYLRYTAADWLHDMSLDATRCLTAMRKAFKQSDEEEDDFYYRFGLEEVPDEELVDEEDKKKIHEEVHGKKE